MCVSLVSDNLSHTFGIVSGQPVFTSTDITISIQGKGQTSHVMQGVPNIESDAGCPEHYFLYKVSKTQNAMKSK